MVALGAVMLSSACKEKNTESDVQVKVNFKYGTEPLVYDQEYSYDTDKKIKVELVKFYVSKPALRNEKGDWISTPTEYFLVALDKPTLNLGKMPVGNYSAIQFGIGVDDSRNTQSDPQAIPATDYPVDHPLNAAADMWWGWDPGYIFAKVEGRIDVNNNGSYSDMEDKVFSYHPGVSNLYRSVELNKTIKLTTNAEEIVLTLDLVKLFDGVKFIDQPVAHPNGVGTPEYVAAKYLMDNFPESFE